MERTVLEKRMKMLNDYLQILMQSGVIETHPQLQRMLLAFLEQGDYDKGVTGGQIARTVTASLPVYCDVHSLTLSFRPL
jgi:sorting nexin-13